MLIDFSRRFFITLRFMLFLRFIFLLFVVGLGQALNAQQFLQTPVEGQYGKDYHIVFYVDWGLGNQELDHQCLSKTYNGHQGTDFIIRSFKTMDSGVHVLAAADGIVVALQDGLFDREKASVISKGLGNYIAIKHANGYFTYYAHLVKNSISVKVGDTIKAGERIAKVGSSGNSSDPHLHFEVWWDSTTLVDPFAGACGNQNTLWLNPLPYDSSFSVWISGLTNFIPFLDTLREEPPTLFAFSSNDSAIAYWSILTGLQKLDTLTLKWFSPSGQLWFEFDYALHQDMGYFYYWSFINVPPSTEAGEWTVKLFRNDSEVDARNFMLNPGTSIKLTNQESERFLIVPNPSSKEVRIVYPCNEHIECHIELLNAQGQTIKKWTVESKPIGSNEQLINVSDLSTGVYWIKLEQAGKVLIERLMVY